MAKFIVIVCVIGIGYAWQKGWVAEMLESPQAREQREQAERTKAQARKRAQQANEEQAPQYWNSNLPPDPRATSATAGVSSRAPGIATDCATARNNVQVTSQWQQQGGAVTEKGSGRRLSENDNFNASAQNRQFIEDNCRGR